MTHRLEKNQVAEALLQEREFQTPRQGPQPGGWHRKEEPPRAHGTAHQQGMCTGAPGDWGHRHPTLEGHTQASMCTRSQGEAGTPSRSGSDLPAGLGGSPGKEVGGCGSLGQGWDTAGRGPGNIHWRELPWRLSFWKNLASPIRVEKPRPNNEQGGNTSPPISKQTA